MLTVLIVLLVALALGSLLVARFGRVATATPAVRDAVESAREALRTRRDLREGAQGRSVLVARREEFTTAWERRFHGRVADEPADRVHTADAFIAWNDEREDLAEQGVLLSAAMWIEARHGQCPYCRRAVPLGAEICPRCRSTQPVPAPDGGAGDPPPHAAP